MGEDSREGRGPLRQGFTTGSCATAASVAAAHLLLGDQSLDAVTIRLPRGGEWTAAIDELYRHGERAHAGVIKDAGDDPDVTHGARVFVDVRLTSENGVRFEAGPGVGVVTRPGLSLAVGEPAINPVPRQMMQTHLEVVARHYDYGGGFTVAVGVENGAALALKTMNPRLGIEGGLSILGTTGIVKPFSCSAYIASIHQGIDVAFANGITHLAACTGSTSEQALQLAYPGLSAMAVVEVGDFVGAFLKHAGHYRFEHISFAGGIAKISKLAFGAVQLHRKDSSVDFSRLAEEAAGLQAGSGLQQRIGQANTVQQVLQLTQQAGVPLAQRLCELARQQLQSRLDTTVWDVIAVDREGKVAARAG